jgi:hypothetical protein
MYEPFAYLGWMPDFASEVAKHMQNASLSPMKFSDTPRHPRSPLWLSLPSATLLIAFAAGCASPRPPHPPSLDLPEVVKDLAAERIGDEVRLRWTTPEKTTDHLEIKGPITAEICRVDHPTAQPPSPCNPVTRVPVQAGTSHVTETLPNPLTVDSATLLAYRVQLLNAHGHSAGVSEEVFVSAGAAPPPVDQLRATVARAGAVLEWQRQSTTASVELDRQLISLVPAKPENPKPPPTPAKPAKPTKSTPFSKSKSTAAPKPSNTATPPGLIKLRTPNQTADAGGTLDATAAKGETYSYTAQRVLAVSLAGHALTLRSLPSAPVTLVMRDIFPPAVPTGLEAVPGGATPSDRSIDLSWTPNTDADLAGYIVYRQSVTSSGASEGTPARLNPTPIPGPAYSDQTAAPGQRYSYRVTAVDAAGNESAPSADVQETLREP